MNTNQNTPAPSNFIALMAQAEVPPITDPPSITVALRKVGNKTLYVCELRTHTKAPSSYPCGSMDSAVRLTNNFLQSFAPALAK